MANPRMNRRPDVCGSIDVSLEIGREADDIDSLAGDEAVDMTVVLPLRASHCETLFALPG